ncbi:MAG: hypothetical protein AB7S72_19345, partial [Draconibacterium sp.]
MKPNLASSRLSCSLVKVSNDEFKLIKFVFCVKMHGRHKLTANVGSYTQGRIAGDFLSNRKAA